jgi:beta-propeller uncharacterized protein DUF5122
MSEFPASIRNRHCVAVGTAIVGLLLGAPSAWGLDSNPAASAVTNGSVFAIAPSPGAIYIAGTFTQVGPRTGPGVAIDAASGQNEGFAQVGGRYGEAVNAVAADGTGGFYIGGSFSQVGGAARNGLAHILSDGSVDPSFNPDPNGTVLALAVSGSTVYAGGRFDQIGGASRNRIAALDATTGAATDWNPNASGTVDAIAVSGSVVYVAGGFESVGGQTRHGLAALDATTGTATGWNPPNVSGSVDAIAVSGSVVYVAGSFDRFGGAIVNWTRNNIAALDATTGAPTGWNPRPNGYEVTTLAISGPTVFAGGVFTHIGGKQRKNIAALDAATGSATSWKQNADDVVSTIAVSGSTVYAGGDFTHIEGQARGHLAAFDRTSGAVSSWNPNANDEVGALAVSGGTVYAGGSFTSIGGKTRMHVAALNPTTGALESWNPRADGPVAALALSGSTVYAGGSFSSIGGRKRRNIAALHASSGTATDWSASTDRYGVVTALALSGSRVYAGGAFSTIDGKTRHNLAALRRATGAVTPWNPNAEIGDPNLAGPAGIYDLRVSGSTVYAAGYFDRVGGKARHLIAALDRTTGAATSWNPNPTGGLGDRHHLPYVSSVRVSGSTVYVAGYFNHIGGRARSGIAALGSATGTATSWNPNARNADLDVGPVVGQILVSGSTVYAGGNFDHIGGQARNRLAALDRATGTARSWAPSPDSAPTALAHGPDGSIWVGGGFSGFSTRLSQSGVARFKP